jgi:PAS domain S-box-containing protein
MDFFDLRTELTVIVALNAILTGMMIFLWAHNRKHSKALVFWMIGYIFQFCSILLLAYRGIISDFFSILLGNLVFLAALVFIIIGLEYFVGLITSQYLNLSLLAVSGLILIVFTYIFPSLLYRYLDISLFFIIISFQFLWLMLHKIDRKLVKGSMTIGGIFTGFILVSIARIVANMVAPPGNDFLNSGIYNSLAILFYQLLYIALCFSLYSLVNNRQAAELENEVRIRKLTEADKIISEARYRSLVESQSDLILRCDLSGKLTFVNDVYCCLAGLAREEILGKECTLVENKEVFSDFLSQEKDLKEFPHPKQVETMVKTPDGARWFSWETTPIFDRGGMLIEHQRVGREITQRKRMEAALLESEDKFRYVFEHSMVAKSITLIHGKVNPNQALLELLGYTVSEFENKTWQEITYPEDLDITKNAVDSLLSEKNESVRFIKRYFHKNGEIIWADVSTSLRRDEYGQPKYFITTLVDITERKKFEEEIAQSARQWQMTFDVTRDAIWVLDEGQRILRYNKSAERIFGVTGKDMLGKHCWEIAHGTMGPIPGCPAVNSKITLRRESMELQFGESWFEVIVDPMIDEVGRYFGSVHVVTDITQRKQQEKQVESKLAELNRWYEVMMGREQRILELKEEVNNLLLADGKPARYMNVE